MATANRTKTGIATAAKRGEIIDLRAQGLTLDAIAQRMGLAGPTGVRYHIDAWLAEQKPSTEQTEELRRLQERQIDSLMRKLEARLDGDDHLAVVDRIVKLMDRKARLLGLDIDRGVGLTVNVLTREWLAEQLAEDGEPAIEGTAVELGAGDSA